MSAKRPNACCNDIDNLDGPVCPNEDSPELTYMQCKVCKCRHFRLQAGELLSLLSQREMRMSKKPRAKEKA